VAVCLASNWSVVSLKPIKGSNYFLDQETFV